jgi:hypothetical protein
MAEIVGFVSKSEFERVRLIREVRAIYDSIFPPADAVDVRPDGRSGKDDATRQEGPAHSKGMGPQLAASSVIARRER